MGVYIIDFYGEISKPVLKLDFTAHAWHNGVPFRIWTLKSTKRQLAKVRKKERLKNFWSYLKHVRNILEIRYNLY